MNKLFPLLILFNSFLIQAQTIVQKKSVDNSVWRINRTVTKQHLQNKKLFGQNNSLFQLTYVDNTVSKSMYLQFASDEEWKRLLFGDFDKWIKSYGSFGWDNDQFIKPTSLTLASYRVSNTQRNELFVLDKFSNTVKVYNIDFVFSGTGGTGNTNLQWVANIDFESPPSDIKTVFIDGVAYLVVSETAGHKISFYDLSAGNYAYRNSYGSDGNGINQFRYPESIGGTCVSFLNQNMLFIEDTGNNRIVLLEINRDINRTVYVTWISSIPINYQVTSMDVDNWGSLWLTDGTYHKIKKYDKSLRFLHEFGTFGNTQNSNLIDNPRSFCIRYKIEKNSSLDYNFYRTDEAYLSERWGDSTGGMRYNLGAEITSFALSYPKIGNYLTGSVLSCLLTDASFYYITVEKYIGSNWTLVRKFGNPIGQGLQYVFEPGSHDIIWDGRDESNNLVNMGRFRFKMQAKELYDDPNAQIQSREIIFNPLPPIISNFTQSPKPLYTSPGNVSNVYCNLSQGHGDLVYHWSYVNKPSNVNLSFNGNKATMSITGIMQNIELLPMFELFCYVTGPYGTSSTQSFLPDIRSSGGGCPFLFVQSDNGYVMDNNLLHRSEFEGNSGKDIKDVYKLKVNPVADKNKLKFQIKELNHDHSYFDRIKLYSVDHPSGTEIGVTENNDIVLYLPSSVVSTSNAILNDKNVTDLIQYNLKSPGVEGISSERIFMNFDTKKLNSGKLLQTYNSDGSADSVAVIMNIEGAGATPIDPKEMAGTIDGSESAEKTTYQRRFARREKQSVVIVPLGNNASLDSLNIEWFRDYDMQYAAVTPVLYGGYKKKELNLIEADHSIHGNIKQLLNKIDKSYAELDTNGFITLTFNEGGKIKSGWTRSYVIETDGYYVLPGAGENKGLTGNSILKEQLTGSTLPAKYELGANYPNPFNPTTTIEYAVPSEGQVTVKVYDILGREVVTLVNEYQSPGRYKVTWNAAGLPSGLYIYRMTAKNFKSVRKMLLVK